MTELAQGGRVEGTIRSKAPGRERGGPVLRPGERRPRQDAPGESDGSAYQEDELQMGYEEAVRRAAEWYRSSLSGPKAEPDDNGAHEAPDAPRHRGAGRDHARSGRPKPPLRQG